MGLNFTAIDFETANFDRGSVCAVGITKVVDGAVVQNESWLVKPPTGLDFTNTYIHGIGPQHVVDAPSWDWTLDRLQALMDGAPLVAYSAFDKGVYNAANKILDLPDRGFVFLDALSVVRQHVALDGYRLPRVVEHFGLSDFNHHEAGADSLACAQIALAIASETGAVTIDELWHKVTERKRVSRARPYQKKAALPGANVEADPGHPLFGEVVCFSGDLDSHTRPEAQKLVADFGASVSSGVTKKTSLVVMGGFDPRTLKAGATLSSKVERAMELAKKGQRIEIVTEQTFLELIQL
ncbi:exonuclease domain-containing protein [Agreia sp. VKM Ac-1783]|uniref:exonuclease domain-containing protein n=1 Tax=Agreia sp. VKM Ac-1783 TaxID=1938889 RepID=UPI000A2ADC5D|nr:exonuclease domain-containing protein [Agreia sp. VKM Ac-1783]SMQ70942.1 DNA polymerase-3 subunit epsilon [Agreia sp. VKM Ac-1783]